MIEISLENCLRSIKDGILKDRFLVCNPTGVEFIDDKIKRCYLAFERSGDKPPSFILDMDFSYNENQININSTAINYTIVTKDHAQSEVIRWRNIRSINNTPNKYVTIISYSDINELIEFYGKDDVICFLSIGVLSDDINNNTPQENKPIQKFSFFTDSDSDGDGALIILFPGMFLILGLVLSFAAPNDAPYKQFLIIGLIGYLVHLCVINRNSINICSNVTNFIKNNYKTFFKYTFFGFIIFCIYKILF